MKTTINPSTLPKEAALTKEWGRQMDIDRLKINILVLDEISDHIITLARAVKDCGGVEQVTGESIWALTKIRDLKIQFQNDIEDIESESN